MSIFKTLGMKNPGVTVVNKLAPKLSTKADIQASKNPVLPKGRASAPRPSSKATSAAPKASKSSGGYKTGGGFKNGGAIKKAGKK
jgi:hypothetical protein